MRGRIVSRVPLAVAAVLALPIFFVSLMAFSLKLEEPDVEKSGLKTTYTAQHGWGEWRIWVASLAAPAVLLLVGAAAMALRRGVFVSCAAAVVGVLVLDHPLATWASEHVGRYPYGEDLIPDNDPGNLLLKGEWEAAAKATAESISHFVIGLAAAIVLVSILLEVRRRRAAAARPQPEPPPRVGLPSPPSAPPDATHP